MLTRYSHKNLTWIDLCSPTHEDIAILTRDFSIHTLVAEELRSHSERAKVDPYPNQLYMILHFPVYGHRTNDPKIYEIDFVIGKDYIITAHYEDIPALDQYISRFKNGRIHDQDKIVHGGFLLYFLLRHLYRDLGDDLRKMEFELGAIEEYIFMGKHKEMVSRIAETNHTILDFKRALKMHRTTLSSLENAGQNFFGNEFVYYLHAISSEFTKIWNINEDGKELLDDLQKTNDSLLTTHTNEIIKNLTLMAFITFPLMLISSTFGMNTTDAPIVGHANDFWILIVVMLIGMFSMLLWFKHKKWL